MPEEITGDLQTLLTGAAFAPATQAFLRITGPDAPRWLNGMVTNNVQALQPGEGNYNFLLNAQGRIQGDCTIYRDPEAKDPTYILQTDPAQIETIQQLLDKFIIMDDVELTPMDEYRHSVLFLGPQAPELLRSVGATSQPDLAPLHIARRSTELITTPPAGLVPQFTVTATTAPQLELLEEKITATGALRISPETQEAFRILEARPRYGTDIRNTETAKDLPQETNQPQALHFAKGCYLGQEIVERIRSRGQVHRQFIPFRLEGTPPTTFPAPLEANGKPAGELTSSATISTTEGHLHLALGYTRREFLETKAKLTYAGGTAHPRTPGKLT